jgi:NAD(P)H-quinone oxidoreductase subunit I
MTEEYELAAFDRHSLNYDNVALGRLPTSVTTDPSVIPLRELAYLPKGEMDPHGVDPNRARAGQLPEQVLEGLPKAPAASEAAASPKGAADA